MSINDFWILLARKLSGESSIEEICDLEELIQAHPDLYFPFEIITNLWNQPGKIDPVLLAYSYSGHMERMKNLGIPMQRDASRDDIGFTYIFHGSQKNDFRGNFCIGIPSGTDCRDHEFYQRNN